MVTWLWRLLWKASLWLRGTWENQREDWQILEKVHRVGEKSKFLLVVQLEIYEGIWVIPSF